MRKRRNYSPEYKAEAFQLVETSDKPLTQIARDLGINPNMLRRWRKEFRENHKAAFPGQGNPRDEELARLKKELHQVKQERGFLREAAAYFARESK